jgi:hypothetical protein
VRPGRPSHLGAETQKSSLILLFAIANLIQDVRAGGAIRSWTCRRMGGGLSADAAPRPGTPAYDAWQAERAKEAAQPKGKDAAR